MSSRCYFCKKDKVLRWSGDGELLYKPKSKEQVLVCSNCLKKLPKWKQEIYDKEKYKEYLQRWDIYLRKI
jgi:hypothetical protein